MLDESGQNHLGVEPDFGVTSVNYELKELLACSSHQLNMGCRHVHHTHTCPANGAAWGVRVSTPIDADQNQKISVYQRASASQSENQASGGWISRVPHPVARGSSGGGAAHYRLPRPER
jgi:hypothetical protein